MLGIAWGAVSCFQKEIEQFIFFVNFFLKFLLIFSIDVFKNCFKDVKGQSEKSIFSMIRTVLLFRLSKKME